MCYLVGSLPNGLVFRHELAERRSTIGRLAISTILLEEESISALHAELIPVGDRKYLLRDLRSKNGTTVEGQKVSEAEIKAPCRLTFGHLSCELQSCDDENCMQHGKLQPKATGSGMAQRPLPPASSKRVHPPDASARNRKTRRLSHKRRQKKPFGIKIELGESSPAVGSPEFRRDTTPESFASPRRHAGDRRFHFSSRTLALGASILLFCAFATAYNGARRVDRPNLAIGAVPTATPASLVLEESIADLLTSENEHLAVADSASAPEPLKGDPEQAERALIAAAQTAAAEKASPSAEISSARTAPEAPNGPANENPAPIAEAPEAEGAAESAPQVAATVSAPEETPAAGKGNLTMAGSAPLPAGESENPEETVFVQEARLLAAVSRPENSILNSSTPLITIGENSDASENETGSAPVDFSVPTQTPHARRPWQFSTEPDSELALNDSARRVAPWSFDALAGRVGETDLASLLNRPQTPSKPVTPPQPAPEKPVVQQPVSVMILGDSLALCGFGTRLDKHFRDSANVRATNTYMACGTVPMSWIKEPPFSSLKTYCGFWTIEQPTPGGKKPVSFQDTYGMGKGKPNAYPVPKLEDLFEKDSPEVLILQTGTNLFSLFRDGKTVQPERHAALLRNQIQPFLAKILKLPTPPRAIYWVASPISGRVSLEVQEFVIQQVTELVGPMAKVIDSRGLVTFPYRHMEPDKEHFIGQDMDQWADRVFDIVQKDLSTHPLPVALARPPGLPGEKIAPAMAKVGSKANANDPSAVTLVGKLLGKSKPMRVEQLKPYQESMVSFVYEVQKVTQGEYREQKILVMHPAHIGLKAQSLDRLRIGKSYELKVHELENSAWNTVKTRDDFGLNELLPYIQMDDEARFPAHEP